MRRTYTTVLAALLLLGLVALPMPGASAEPAECNDAIDNDGDGQTDYPDDPDCTAPEDNTETTPPPTECQDGLDNDGDGRIDYGEDPDCTRYGDDQEASGVKEDDWHDRYLALKPFRHEEFPRYQGLVIRGLVRSEKSRCVAKIPVKIQVRDDGHWVTWKTDTTTQSGFFRVIVRDLPGRFRAVATRRLFEQESGTQAGCRRAQDIRRHHH